MVDTLTASAALFAALDRDDLYGVEDVRQEGSTITFTVDGVRYCAVVECDEDALIEDDEPRGTDEAAAFLAEWAGYGVRPGETTEQAKARTGRELADAEAWGRSVGLRFEWVDDPDEPDAFVCSALNPIDWTVEASLGGIDGPTDEYRRVIEAELAEQVRYERREATGR